MTLSRLLGQPRAPPYLRAWALGSLVRPLLLYGPEGVGKRSATFFATQEAFCGKAPPCACFHCQTLAVMSHPDVTYLPPETKVEDVREALAMAHTPPGYAPFRLLVIDGAEGLHGASANALLKRVEEPPDDWRVVLLATCKKRVIPALQGRCIPVPFLPLSVDTLSTLLAPLEKSTPRVKEIAAQAGGSMATAIRLWKEASQGHKQALALLEAVSKGDVSLTLALAQDAQEKGWVSQLTYALRDLLMVPSKVHVGSRSQEQWRALLVSVSRLSTLPETSRGVGLKAALLDAML